MPSWQLEQRNQQSAPGLLTCELIHSRCVKLLNLWQFVTPATEKEYTCPSWVFPLLFSRPRCVISGPAAAGPTLGGCPSSKAEASVPQPGGPCEPLKSSGENRVFEAWRERQGGRRGVLGPTKAVLNPDTKMPHLEASSSPDCVEKESCLNLIIWLYAELKKQTQRSSFCVIPFL